MDKRELFAAGLAALYLGACALALWDRLAAVALLAVASPVAAAFMFPKGANRLRRVLMGASIDALLAGLAFVPVVGDLADAGAGLVAVVLIAMRFKQFAVSLPAGAACVILYLFLWFDGKILSVSGAGHPLWRDLLAVAVVLLAGGALAGLLTLLLGRYYHGDRPQAVFSALGFPWYLATFLVTIFLPGHRGKRGHQAAGVASRSDY